MKKSLSIMLLFLFALLRAQDASAETVDAAVEATDGSSDGDSAEGAEVTEEASQTEEGEASEESGDSESGDNESAAQEESGEGSSDDSLNNQINTTIQEIQSSLQGEGAEAEGVSMTEDNVTTLVGNLWPSVQNFIEQSLAEVSTLDEMSVDEVTEEEAALIRSKYYL
jgi:hypothetical protein